MHPRACRACMRPVHMLKYYTTHINIEWIFPAAKYPTIFVCFALTAPRFANWGTLTNQVGSEGVNYRLCFKAEDAFSSSTLCFFQPVARCMYCSLVSGPSAHVHLGALMTSVSLDRTNQEATAVLYPSGFPCEVQLAHPYSSCPRILSHHVHASSLMTEPKPYPNILTLTLDVPVAATRDCPDDCGEIQHTLAAGMCMMCFSQLVFSQQALVCSLHNVACTCMWTFKRREPAAHVLAYFVTDSIRDRRYPPNIRVLSYTASHIRRHAC